MSVITIGIIVFLLLLSCVTSYYAIKFGIILLNVQDSINDSLDELDESYIKIKEISEKPIFFDSVEVRQCISEIINVRNAVIKIATRLTNIGTVGIIGSNNNPGDAIERQKENN